MRNSTLTRRDLIPRLVYGIPASITRMIGPDAPCLFGLALPQPLPLQDVRLAGQLSDTQVFTRSGLTTPVDGPAARGLDNPGTVSIVSRDDRAMVHGAIDTHMPQRR
jgi:hypothetical protein